MKQGQLPGILDRRDITPSLSKKKKKRERLGKEEDEEEQKGGFKKPDAIVVVEKKKTMASSSSPVHWHTNFFFSNQDMLSYLSQLLDMKTMGRLSVCNKRLCEVLGSHVDMRMARLWKQNNWFNFPSASHGQARRRRQSYSESVAVFYPFYGTGQPGTFAAMSEGYEHADPTRFLCHLFSVSRGLKGEEATPPRPAEILEITTFRSVFVFNAVIKLVPRRERLYSDYVWGVLSEFNYSESVFESCSYPLEILKAIEAAAKADGMPIHWKTARMKSAWSAAKSTYLFRYESRGAAAVNEWLAERIE